MIIIFLINKTKTEQMKTMITFSDNYRHLLTMLCINYNNKHAFCCNTQYRLREGSLKKKILLFSFFSTIN